MFKMRNKRGEVMGRWQRLVVCLSVIAGLGLVSSQTHAWNPGTHNHVANILGSTQGISNYHEMYGGMALDTFNFSSDPLSLHLANLLHTDQAMQLWQRAQIAGTHALPVAYGFMTHNNVWGADYTAHWNGRTFGQGIGYVIAKAQLLQTLAPLPPELGVSPEDELLMDHLVVESAVDVLMKQHLDPRLGQKIIQAVTKRPPEFPALLVDAYADDLLGEFPSLSPAQAQAFIVGSESAFQNIMTSYGQALADDEPVPELAAQLSALAGSYLGPLPVSEELLTLMLTGYINVAMGLCSDFEGEISATITFVDQQLELHDITYDVSAVPLPPSLLLFGFGLAGLGLLRLKP